jgi:hypothetical protein
MLFLITNSPSVNGCLSTDVFSKAELLTYLPGLVLMTLFILDGFYVHLMCTFMKKLNEFRQRPPATQALNTTENQPSLEIKRENNDIPKDCDTIITVSQSKNGSDETDRSSCLSENVEIAVVNTLKQSDSMLSLSDIGGAVVSNQAVCGAAVSNQDIGGAVVSNQAVGGAVVSNQAISGAAVSDQAIDGAAVSNQAICGAAVSNQAICGAVVSNQAIGGAAVSNQAISGAAVSNHQWSGRI